MRKFLFLFLLLLPLLASGPSKSAPSSKPSFSFSSKPASSKPSFSFSSKPASSKPSFSFSSKPPEPSKSFIIEKASPRAIDKRAPVFIQNQIQVQQAVKTKESREEFKAKENRPIPYPATPAPRQVSVPTYTNQIPPRQVAVPTHPAPIYNPAPTPTYSAPQPYSAPAPTYVPVPVYVNNSPRSTYSTPEKRIHSTQVQSSPFPWGKFFFWLFLLLILGYLAFRFYTGYRIRKQFSSKFRL